jgi:hypothetical protein
VATFIALLNPGSIEELNRQLKWFSRINGAWVDWLISLENRGELSEFQGELQELAKRLIRIPPDPNEAAEEALLMLVDRIMEFYDLPNPTSPDVIEKEWSRSFGSRELAQFFGHLLAEMSINTTERPLADPEGAMLSFLSMVSVFYPVAMQRREETPPAIQPANREDYKVGRNDPCPCGSGKKYKKCCLGKKDAKPLPATPPIEAPMPLLSDKEIAEFFSIWKRFMTFVHEEYCVVHEMKYRPLFHRGREPRFQEWVSASYYNRVRDFLVRNFSLLVDAYPEVKRVSKQAMEVLKECARHHRSIRAVVFEFFPEGTTIFFDIEENRRYYTYPLLSPFSEILQEGSEAIYDVLLLSYKRRIISDGIVFIEKDPPTPEEFAVWKKAYEQTRGETIFRFGDEPETREEGVPSRTSGTTIYRLKISLEHVKPPVWRRIDLPADVTLEQLHELIQILFGWENMHLHEFEAQGIIYAPEDSETMNFGLFETPQRSEERTTLQEVLHKEKEWMTYIYDFGDNWRHRIVLEKILPPEEGVIYPRCLKVKGPNLPEDSGGMLGMFSQEESQRPVPDCTVLESWMRRTLDAMKRS